MQIVRDEARGPLCLQVRRIRPKLYQEEVKFRKMTIVHHAQLDEMHLFVDSKL